MNKVPSRLKWVIGFILLGVVMQLASIGMSIESAVAPRFLGIVISIGVATGLARGSQIAWNLGRILNLMALILIGFMVAAALVAQFHGISPLMVFVWLAVSLLQSGYIFFALGAQDVRLFCGVKTNRKEAQPKHPR